MIAKLAALGTLGYLGYKIYEQAQHNRAAPQIDHANRSASEQPSLQRIPVAEPADYIEASAPR